MVAQQSVIEQNDMLIQVNNVSLIDLPIHEALRIIRDAVRTPG